MDYCNEVLPSGKSRNSSRRSSVHSESSVAIQEMFDKYYAFKLRYIWNFFLWMVSLVTTITLSLYFYFQLKTLNNQIEVLQNQALALITRQEFFETLLKNEILNSTIYDIENEYSDLNSNYVNDEDNYVEEIEEENQIFDPENNGTGSVQPLRPSFRKSRKKKQTKPDITAVHFKGSLPQITVFDDGKVGPWKADDLMTRKTTLRLYRMEDRNTTIRINSAGLYLIYVQVKYETMSAFNSFSVHLLTRELNHDPIVLSECNAYGAPYIDVPVDVNCYTSFVKFLKAQDSIYLHQNLRNSTIILTPGHSFLGLVQLYRNPTN